jgi:cobaltochelatase CobS
MKTAAELFGFAPDTPLGSRKVAPLDWSAGDDTDLDHPETSLTALIPDRDPAYHFDPDTTVALLAGFELNRRVMLQGAHGTGKSTHVEQVAARLNWPLLRINLDGHLTRADLVGRDAIVVRDGMQITEFQEGLLPWAIRRPVAVLFDEFDAGRPDVMFVIQRVLERDGRFTLLDRNQVITPHPRFRMFAATNTVGLGDHTGLYRGTNVLNQAQIDRWSIVAHLDYLDPADEQKVVLGQVPEMAERPDGAELVASMVEVANMTRTGFAAGDISTLMSPRTVIAWAENTVTFGDALTAFRLSFVNKCDEAEAPIVAEYHQRVFG